MKAILWLTAGVVLGLALTGGAPPAQDAEQDKLTALVKSKRDAARKTYETTWQNYRDGRRGAEALYWWSRRWLESEQQLSDKKSDQFAAAQKHLERMRDLEKVVRDLQRANVITIDEISAAEFFRAEAELWVRQARN